jgi:hypothetical protein
MHYFGATGPAAAVRTSLDRNDVFYLVSLGSSVNVDLDALISAGQASYTQSKAKLLLDKGTLWNDAAQKFTTFGQAGADLLNSMPTEKGLLSDLMAKIPDKARTVTAWTPVADSGPVTVTAYRKGVPFCSAPVIAPSSALAPSADTLSKLSTLTLNLSDYQAAMARSSVGYVPAGGGKIPTIAIIAGLALAAFLLTR